MNKAQRDRIELIVSGESEPQNETELLFVEALRIGKMLPGPVELYGMLCERFPEIQSDAVEALLLGYDVGIAIGAQEQLENEDEMLAALREFNGHRDDEGFH